MLSRIVNFESDIFDLNELQIVILDLKDPKAEMRPYYNEAYKHWHSRWFAHFNERDHIKKLASDNFSRQEHIFSIFWRHNCVGAVCFRTVDMAFEYFRHDSYFEPWPEKCIQGLVQEGHRIVIGSQISIEPNCPKFANGVKLRDLILFMTLHYYTPLRADAITGTARKDRHMQKTFEQFGATYLAHDIDFHGGKVDLMAFFTSRIKDVFSPELSRIGEHLWNLKIGLPNQPLKYANRQEAV